MLRIAGKLLGLSIAVCAATASGQSIQSVLNAASYTASIARGTWVAIFGTNLATGAPLAAASVPFPLQLAGVSVTVAGVAAPLSYVAASQINALVPFEAATLTATQTAQAPVVVKTAAGTAGFSITLTRNAPAIYTKNYSGSGPALVFDPNFNVVTTVGTSPIVLYATGLGPTNPVAVTGSLGASAEPLNRVVDAVSVSIGETPATVLYAGLAPGFEGIYQINVTPQTPFVGNALSVSVGNHAANSVTLPVTAGTNVVNVTGSIDGLYPASGAYAQGGKSTSNPILFSPLLTAAVFSVSFDILPGANPFQVVAQSTEGGGVAATIDITPAAGTWQATYTVPTDLERQWNFSQSSLIAISFPDGLPLPGNSAPPSALDPLALLATGYLALPNYGTVSLQNNGTLVFAGTLPAGGHFSTTLFQSFAFAGESASLPPGFTGFGGFVSIPFVPGKNVVTFQLFVDSQLVASTPVSFAEFNYGLP
jgi:uncharacterized protein (TIGR03437 family)